MSKFIVQILKGADSDIEQAIDWYESQKIGLGFDFYHSFRDITQLLSENPFLFQEHFLFVRRAFLNRFPYTVFYAIDEQHERVEIIAVLHQRIHPDELKKRINFV